MRAPNSLVHIKMGESYILSGILFFVSKTVYFTFVNISREAGTIYHVIHTGIDKVQAANFI